MTILHSGHSSIQVDEAHARIARASQGARVGCEVCPIELPAAQYVHDTSRGWDGKHSFQRPEFNDGEVITCTGRFSLIEPVPLLVDGVSARPLIERTELIGLLLARTSAEMAGACQIADDIIAMLTARGSGSSEQEVRERIAAAIEVLQSSTIGGNPFGDAYTSGFNTARRLSARIAKSNS